MIYCILDYSKQEGDEASSFHQLTEAFKGQDCTPISSKKQVKKQDVHSAESSIV